MVDKDEKKLKKQLKKSQPTLSESLEGKSIHIIYSNTDKIYIKFYLIDLEILFSRSPSLKALSQDFSLIQPNYLKVLDVEKKQTESIIDFEIPNEYSSRNLFIEISIESIKKFETYYSSEIKLIIYENIGELKVTDKDLKPIPKAYVKCFCETKGNTMKFYKDGYTDFRGKFNYLALNSDLINEVKQFYLFVSDDKLGAITKTCNLPNNIKDGQKITFDDFQQARNDWRNKWRIRKKI